jgi:ATP:ADP antiporter, AAA family
MARDHATPPFELDPVITRRQRIRSSLLSLFRWEDGDAQPAVRGALLLFLIVAAFVVLKTLRDALFLSIYPARLLPKYMALNTVVSAVIAFGILRLYKRIPLRRVLQASLLLFAVSPLFIWERLPGHFHIKPSTLYVLVGIYGTMIPVQGWALVSTALSSRQGKRTLGFIGSGAILGGIGGGLLSRILVNEWGLQSLIPCASILIFAAFAACPAASSNLAEVAPSESAAAVTRRKMRFRYALLLLIIITTGTIVSTFLDFQFKAYTQREFQTEKTLGSFIGTFYALLGVSSLIFQLLITPFILRRASVTIGLAAMPFVLLVGSSLMYFWKSFAAIVTLRGSEELMRHSLDRSSFEVILMAIPVHQKIRLKSLVETVGIRTSELIGCMILIALFTRGDALPLTTLTVVNMGLTFLWFSCSLWLGIREYPALLREELRREELDLATVRENLFSNEFYRVLPALLRNADKDTILSILELLEESNKDWLGRYLTSITHQDPEIRLRTLQLLFLQKTDMRYRVKRLLSDPELRVRAEAVHYMCTRSRSPDEYINRFKQDESLAIRAATYAPGLKSGRKEDTDELETLFKKAEQDKDETALQEIAHLLQFIPPTDFSVKLYKKLLSNRSLDVRKAALKSIGHTKPQLLIPVLLKLTRVPALKTEVRATLTRYGKMLIPYLDAIIQNPGESLPRRKLALKIAADTGGISILESVLKAAKDPNVSLRFSAIKTLNYFQKNETLAPTHQALLPIIYREIAVLESELKRAFLFEPDNDRLIATLLKQRVLWTYERVFRGLALIFPQDAIYHAYLGWVSGDLRKRDAAIEFLEQTLPPELRDRLLPLLEYTPPEEVDEKKRATNRAIAFQSFLEEKDPLLVAAAIPDLSDVEFQEHSVEILEYLKERPATLIEEMLRRRTETMNHQEGNQPLTMIEKMENLAKIDLFSRLSAAELLLLGEVATEVEFQPDDIIFKEGDPAEEIYSLLQGRVELRRGSEFIREIGPGESFGTLGVLSNQNRTTTATVLEHAKCLKIHGDTFWEILEDYTPVCHGVIEVLANRIDQLTAQVAGVSIEPSPVDR